MKYWGGGNLVLPNLNILECVRPHPLDPQVSVSGSHQLTPLVTTDNVCAQLHHQFCMQLSVCVYTRSV